MQIIHGLIVDYGDGSSGICWFRDAEKAEARLDRDEYYANEGSINITLSFPDDLNLEQCGFGFSD